MEKNNIKTVAFFTLFILLLVVLIAIFWPFLRPIATSAIFAVLIMPLFKILKKKTGSKTFSAIICVLTIVFVIVIPLLFMGVQLFKEVNDAARLLNTMINQERLGRSINAVTQHKYFIKFMPFIKEQMLAFEVDLYKSAYQIFEAAAKYMASNSIVLARNILWFIVEIFVVLITTFFMLRDSDKIISTLKDFSPFRKEETSRLFEKIKVTVHASVFGGIFVSLIQGAMGGLAFYALGLPSPILWGVIMAIIGIIPIIGPSTVWLPAGIILLINGSVLKGVLLLVWGAFFMGFADNLLRPVFVGKGTEFHPLLIFFSIFGAVILMGSVGFFMGPVILALTLTTADFLKDRYKD